MNIVKLAEKFIWLLKDNQNIVSCDLVYQRIPEIKSNFEQVQMMISQWGYRLEVNENEFELASVPDRLIDTEIKYQLGSSFIGQEIHSYQSIQSTNDIALALAESDHPEGTLVIAEQQTRGRGRMGRVWHSPIHGNIYLSLILRPALRPEDAPGLAIITALAMAESLEPYLPGQIKIKWPNDLLINGKKVAGILSELGSEKDKINFVIIGLGINVNINQNLFPEELKDIATSISHEKGEMISRVELLKKFLLNFEKYYLSYQSELLHPHLEKIKNYSSLLGKTISFQKKDKFFEGKAVGLSPNGNLIVESEGKTIPINSGEVTIVKK